jgi:hypothetical protein
VTLRISKNKAAAILQRFIVWDLSPRSGSNSTIFARKSRIKVKAHSGKVRLAGQARADPAKCSKSIASGLARKRELFRGTLGSLATFTAIRNA